MRQQVQGIAGTVRCTLLLRRHARYAHTMHPLGVLSTCTCRTPQRPSVRHCVVDTARVPWRCVKADHILLGPRRDVPQAGLIVFYLSLHADLEDLQGEGTACLDVGREYHLPLLPLDGKQPELPANSPDSVHISLQHQLARDPCSFSHHSIFQGMYSIADCQGWC